MFFNLLPRKLSGLYHRRKAYNVEKCFPPPEKIRGVQMVLTCDMVHKVAQKLDQSKGIVSKAFQALGCWDLA